MAEKHLLMESWFPRADAYQQLVPGYAGALRPGESPSTHTVRERRYTEAFAYTERHLKCVWFDPAVRPALLKTEQGDDIVIEHAGRWNLEAGPDFLGATVRVGPDRRCLTGDVEIHIRPSDWHRHGHVRNPAYARVIAHVTYFPGYLPAENLPPGCIQIALKDALAANPCFSFDNLDVTAYPYARQTSVTPCARILASWTPDTLVALFESAGEDRLRRKAERLALAIGEKGPDQVLYEELMSACGYKQNRAPFRTMAEEFPLTALRESAGGNVITAYALLMGIAGLLPAQTDTRWDADTRAFVRQLWNCWWKHQSQWSHCALKSGDWTLSGIRPQNHPRRRLMAAAFLFTQRTMPGQQLLSLRADKPQTWMDQAMAWLQPDADTYWRHRLTLGGRQQSAAVSLIGGRRTAAIISNVILPLLAALTRHDEALSPGRSAPAQPGGRSGDPSSFPSIEILRRLPTEEDNSIIRQAAQNLLGPDHNPKLYRTGLRQQGLIQIFHDFCLNDRSHCAACPLVGRLASFPP